MSNTYQELNSNATPGEVDSLLRVRDDKGNRKCWLILSVSFLFFSALLTGIVPIKQAMLETGRYSQDSVDAALIVAQVVMVASAFPVGIFHDRVGPWKTAIIAGIWQCLGHGLLSLSFFVFKSEVILTVSCAMDAIANTLIYFSLFHIANAFPGKESVVICAFTGVWDLSTILGYIVLRLSKVGVPIHLQFGVSAAIYVIFTILVAMYLPRTLIQRKDHDSNGNNDDIKTPKKGYGVRDSEPTVEDAGSTEKEKTDTHTIVAMITISAMFYQLQTNYYMLHVKVLMEGTVSHDPNYSNTTNTLKKGIINTAITSLSLMIPIVGFGGAFVIGIFVSKFQIKFAWMVILFLEVLFSLVTLLPNYEIQYVGFALFAIYRLVMYASINDGLLKIVGAEKIGFYSGLVYTVGGTFNALNYIIDLVVKQYYQNDFTTMTYIVAGSTTLVALTSLLVLFLKSRNAHQLLGEPESKIP